MDELVLPSNMPLDDTLTVDNIRNLFSELRSNNASEKSKILCGRLGTKDPCRRLMDNLSMCLRRVSERRSMYDVMVDLLTNAEMLMLVELDAGPYSVEARETARKLLSVKERWFLCKNMSGFIRRSFESEAKLDVD